MKVPFVRPEFYVLYQSALKLSKQVSRVRMMKGKYGFDGRQPITTISYLEDSHMSCNVSDVYESSDVWMLLHLLFGSTRSSYRARLSRSEDARRHRPSKHQKIKSY